MAAVTHYYVQNTSNETVAVTLWKTKRTLPPGKAAQFQFAIHSNLPVKVVRANGTTSYNRKHFSGIIPGDHIAVVNGSYRFQDLGKTANSKKAEQAFLTTAKALGLLFGWIS